MLEAARNEQSNSNMTSITYSKRILISPMLAVTLRVWVALTSAYEPTEAFGSPPDECARPCPAPWRENT